ncbi:interferon-induced GTP-binding protein Mx2 [Pteropus vampyrus]|uniref:Interferon-induced GTP-binding protein Mx2 n=1 Tax=Pteropus vampyrus TaxID=132908 RepID=A0A6P6D417_PTEVA|nr:interferon-induced GTP-binding protein Mx2 [Pteropus vampyrus]
MPKSHKLLLQQRHNQAPSQHYPKKEMNLFQQHSLLFASARGHVKMPPNVSVGDKDPVNLCKNINSLTLNPPLPEENVSQENIKGPESSLFAHYEDKVRPCIDLIDSLRALGVEQDLALPAIAVIGDQSSGKSSVLEALSGVALPRGSGITTRCPLELKLKKQLSCEAPWSGKISYRDTELQIQTPLQVEKEIHRAQNIIAGNGVGISHELISLEITSPEVPDLTLIDLPGIARVAVGNQPQDIGAQLPEAGVERSGWGHLTQTPPSSAPPVCSPSATLYPAPNSSPNPQALSAPHPVPTPSGEPPSHPSKPKGGDSSVRWVETGDAAKHPTVHRTAPTAKSNSHCHYHLGVAEGISTSLTVHLILVGAYVMRISHSEALRSSCATENSKTRRHMNKIAITVCWLLGHHSLSGGSSFTGQLEVAFLVPLSARFFNSLASEYRKCKLGWILTKPDLVDKGTEKMVVNVVQNLTYRLKKGYMIVRCRGQQEVADRLSLAEATRKETMFFQAHPYFRALLEEGKATVPRLAERLTIELITHITKSLPLLESQIRECHQSATDELRQCGEHIPSSDSDKMFFLIEKIKMFNRDIEKLVEGEEVVKEKETRLYNKLREEFKAWVLVLAANTQKVKNTVHQEISKYEKQYRGKELPGFVNYKTFEIIVQQYLQQLVDPALEMLQKAVEIVRQTFVDTARNHFGEFSNLNKTVQSRIEEIKIKRAETADSVIRLQFRMEQQVYCQDQIYSRLLEKAREDANSLGKTASLQFPLSNDVASVSSITEIGVHLNAYFLETSNRLANQIPFIIQYFMLQENSDYLQKAMMQMLQEREHYTWLLQEQSETAAKRQFLKEKIYRLTQARRALYKFSC